MAIDNYDPHRRLIVATTDPDGHRLIYDACPLLFEEQYLTLPADL